MADFLQVKMQKTLFLDYIAQYATPNSAEKAVKLKCQKIRKNSLTSKNAFKDVNWNLLLIQAKARQKAFKRSTALLTAATDEAANTLENLFAGQNDYDEGGEEEEVEEEEVQTHEAERTEKAEAEQTQEAEGEQMQGQEKSNGKRKYQEMILEKYELMAGACPKDGYLLPSGTRLHKDWHTYKTHAVTKMNQTGLYLAAELYEVIEELYRTLKEKYVDADIYISDELQLGVTKVLRKLVGEDREASRRDSELELLVLSHVLEEDERVLVDVIRSWPETKKCFRWLNQQVIEYGAEPTNLRPDAIMTLDPTWHETYAVGYCEVKASAAEKHHQDTHLDTLRTALFCKDALDRSEVKCTLGVQVIGFCVQVYLCSLESEALYPFFLLEKFEVPSSLLKLPKFISELDKLKRILKAYNKHCVKKFRIDIDKLKRPSVPAEHLFKILNAIVPTNFKPTLDFK
ncbi:hypothetical protein [Parasitella parasitica]|uniref:Uncharacterized protein n=1 Tax=Parasitella parasitica TaxID=35722 RepID=A0A0B7N058_9FUNG|nr:hypothetical protein [Parasitella parasitica]